MTRATYSNTKRKKGTDVLDTHTNKTNPTANADKCDLSYVVRDSEEALRDDMDKMEESESPPPSVCSAQYSDEANPAPPPSHHHHIRVI